MISKRKIKEIMEECGGKKISGKAIVKVESFLEVEVKRILKKAAKKADYAGRVIVMEKDILGWLV